MFFCLAFVRVHACLPPCFLLVNKTDNFFQDGSVRYQQRFRRTEFCWAFSCYLVLLNLYWAAVPGRTFNEFHTCSNTCSLAVMFNFDRFETTNSRSDKLPKLSLAMFADFSCLCYGEHNLRVRNAIFWITTNISYPGLF